MAWLSVQWPHLSHWAITSSPSGVVRPRGWSLTRSPPLRSPSPSTSSSSSITLAPTSSSLTLVSHRSVPVTVTHGINQGKGWVPIWPWLQGPHIPFPSLLPHVQEGGGQAQDQGAARVRGHW